MWESGINDALAAHADADDEGMVKEEGEDLSAPVEMEAPVTEVDAEELSEPELDDEEVYTSDTGGDVASYRYRRMK